MNSYLIDIIKLTSFTVAMRICIFSLWSAAVPILSCYERYILPDRDKIRSVLKKCDPLMNAFARCFCLTVGLYGKKSLETSGSSVYTKSELATTTFVCRNIAELSPVAQWAELRRYVNWPSGSGEEDF